MFLFSADALKTEEIKPEQTVIPVIKTKLCRTDKLKPNVSLEGYSSGYVPEITNTVQSSEQTKSVESQTIEEGYLNAGVTCVTTNNNVKDNITPKCKEESVQSLPDTSVDRSQQNTENKHVNDLIRERDSLYRALQLLQVCPLSFFKLIIIQGVFLRLATSAGSKFTISLSINLA